MVKRTRPPSSGAPPPPPPPRPNRVAWLQKKKGGHVADVALGSGRGGIQFYLNRLSTDSLYLPAEHLYYKVYLDDEEFTFDTDTYTTLEEPLVEVPYLYTDNNQIQYYGDDHIFYFYISGFDKIGIQEIYNDGTTKLASGIVWQEVESEEEDGVEAIKANVSSVKSVKYCDLSGRAVSKISHGLYIKTTTLADGTVITKKVMVK